MTAKPATPTQSFTATSPAGSELTSRQRKFLSYMRPETIYRVKDLANACEQIETALKHDIRALTSAGCIDTFKTGDTTYCCLTKAAENLGAAPDNNEVPGCDPTLGLDPKVEVLVSYLSAMGQRTRSDLTAMVRWYIDPPYGEAPARTREMVERILTSSIFFVRIGIKKSLEADQFKLSHVGRLLGRHLRRKAQERLLA